MTNNYAKGLPFDKNGVPMQEYPAPFISNTRSTIENGTPSSVIALRSTTSTIEVGTSGGQGAVIRWIPLTESDSVSPFGSVVASGLGANYDHYIPPNTFRRFVVPKETQGLGTAPMQVGSTFGLYQRVARVNAGVTASSILVIEY